MCVVNFPVPPLQCKSCDSNSVTETQAPNLPRPTRPSGAKVIDQKNLPGESCKHTNS